MLKFALIELHQKRDDSPLRRENCDEIIELIYKADPDFNFLVDLWESCNMSDKIVEASRREEEESFDSSRREEEESFHCNIEKMKVSYS